MDIESMLSIITAINLIKQHGLLKKLKTLSWPNKEHVSAFTLLNDLRREVYKICYLPRKLSKAKSILAAKKRIEVKSTIIDQVRNYKSLKDNTNIDRWLCEIEQSLMMINDELQGKTYNASKLVGDYKRYFSVQNKKSTMHKLLSEIARKGKIKVWLEKHKDALKN
jgi:hypothetical protein